MLTVVKALCTNSDNCLLTVTGHTPVIYIMQLIAGPSKQPQNGIKRPRTTVQHMNQLTFLEQLNWKIDAISTTNIN